MKLPRETITVLFDQVFVSLTNFLTTIFLIRFIGIEGFGVFAIAWLLIQFLNSIQYAFISSPMMILESQYINDDKKKYFGSLVIIQLIFSFSQTFVVWIFVSNLSLINPLWDYDYLSLSLVFCLFFFQIQDFVRRVLFTTNNTFKALLIDFVAYILRLIFLIYILSYNEISVSYVLWIIAFFSFLSIFLSIDIFIKFIYKKNNLVEIFYEHWKISKWLISTTLLQWLSGNYFIVASASLLGPVSVGLIKTAENVIGVVNILIQGLENIAPKNSRREFVTGSYNGLKKYLVKLLSTGTLITLITVFIIIFNYEIVISFFYGKKIDGIDNLIYMYGICYILSYILFSLRIGLLAIKNTKSLFISNLITTLFSIVSAGLFIKLFFEEGAILGIIIVQLLSILILIFYIKRDFYLKK